LNDGLTYALEARDFENFQEMENKAPVLENHRGVMAVDLHYVLLHLQLDLCSIMLSRSFSRSRRQLDKDFLPHSIK
jgi:hypothetical protein